MKANGKCAGAVAACVLLVGTLVGCSGREREVASLNRSPSAEAAQETQAGTAEALRDCLVAAGIPAVTVQLDSEYAAISFESDDVYQLQGRSGTVTSGSGRREVTVEEWERTEAKRAEHEQKYTASDGTVSPFLFIGDDDFTEPWVACLDQTGYLEPNVPADPGDELKQKQLWARASAEWAGCARDNGFPTTKDPTAPVADNYETTPTAVLPSTIQPDELRTLLEVCPNFDPDGDQEITEDEAEAIGGYFGTVDPVIGFDLPGYDGGSSPGSGLVDEAVAARLAELQRVLNEALAEFYARTVQQG